MKKLVNAIGDPCPIPVVKTKNAIKELNGQKGCVETLVDNEIAVQNLTKMAVQKQYGVSAEKMEENKFRVIMEIPSLQESNDDVSRGKSLNEENRNEDICCIPDGRKKSTVIVISSSLMGEGDPELGTALMKSYLYALAQQDELPGTLLFYNGGVKLTCEDSASLEDLKSLEAQGVEILSCGTCLNFYGLTEKLQVGSVTNMYVIAEKMSQADLIIKP